MNNKELKQFVEGVEEWKKWATEVVSNLNSQPSEATKQAITDLRCDIKELKQSLDKRYSSKWVESLMRGFIATVLLYFLGALLFFKFQKKLF